MTTDTTNLHLDAEIEFGCIFGKVHASTVFDSVGAHVEIDGNVISDTGLRSLYMHTEPIDAARAVRHAAFDAVRRAYVELGLDYGDFDQHAAIIKALPLTPFL